MNFLSVDRSTKCTRVLSAPALAPSERTARCVSTRRQHSDVRAVPRGMATCALHHSRSSSYTFGYLSRATKGRVRPNIQPDIQIKRSPLALHCSDKEKSDAEGHRSKPQSDAKKKDPAREPVVLRVYDISRGRAVRWSKLVLGYTVEGIWHTGVVAFGAEYFFGEQIEKMLPRDVEKYYNLHPYKIISLGYTTKTVQQFEDYLSKVESSFSSSTYDLLTWNCNNFSNCAANFLCGKGIPSEILNLPQEIQKNFVGSFLVDLLMLYRGDNPVRSSGVSSHMNPMASGGDNAKVSYSGRSKTPLNNSRGRNAIKPKGKCRRVQSQKCRSNVMYRTPFGCFYRTTRDGRMGGSPYSHSGRRYSDVVQTLLGSKGANGLGRGVNKSVERVSAFSPTASLNKMPTCTSLADLAKPYPLTTRANAWEQYGRPTCRATASTGRTVAKH